MILKVNYIGCLCINTYDCHHPCITVMIIRGQPLIYSAYPYSYSILNNASIEEVI